jgi:ribonuclease HI
MSITIWTDGSSRGNPGPGGFGAIVRTQSLVVELGGREGDTTNNRMELSAAIRALEWVRLEKLESESMVIYSDSKYVIQGITSWVKGWKQNGWKTAGKKDVGNRDLWEKLDSLARGLSIDWKYVEGHAGHPGNERCDDIATSFADNIDPHLYIGPRNLYTIDLDAASKISSAEKKRSSSAKAYSYVSLIDGVFETHKTWAECEARVKGVKGARFKKSTSAEEEQAIKKEWLGK